MKFSREPRESFGDLKHILELNHEALMCTSNYLHVQQECRIKVFLRI